MIYVALAELAVIGVLVWLSYRERRTHDKAMLDILASAEVERGELLSRITHPERMPVRAPAAWKPEPPADAANLAKIGTVAKEAGDGR